MALTFPSDEWVQELVRQLNQSEAYERSAKDWEGDFIFVIESDEMYPDTAYLFLGLLHGKSTEGAVLASRDGREAEFVISAPYKVWRRVVEGDLDPIQAMMTKKLKLKGNLMKIMRYPAAAKEIIACCARVPTDFVD